ncbi:uncharacterized protein LOC126747098 isoform X2 [Anthonomus grandis grandis]|uniref:uncharacterized protein LOC126747098 isoform X2 n=1 Tax=Anthonomus grandis grandis TaxID=2921223 RepID=UPI0021664E43|nr:uncharacterized protein LOC126747098 isoform X2 [Anthonomus grandis grandis]
MKYYSWSIILILLVSLELTLGRPENGNAIETKGVELPQATESTILPLEISTIVSAPVKGPSQVQGGSDVNSLPNQNISEELKKNSTLNPPDGVSKNFSNDHKTSYEGSMSNGGPNQIVPASPAGQDLLDPPLEEDAKKSISESKLPGSKSNQDPGSATSVKSPLDVPFEDKFQEVSKPSFSDSPLAYKPLRPSYASSMSNGVPNQIVPARVDAPQDVPVKKDFKPLVPGTAAIDSAQPPAKSPLDIPFEEKFQEVAKPAFSDSPLAYKPLRPSYAGSMSNGVPNQIIPARVDAPQDVPVKKDFKPSVPGAPAVDSAQLPAKSPLDIPFEEKFQEVSKPSFSDSPLAYKPLRPSYAGSMSNGVPNQIAPAKVDSPQDLPAVNSPQDIPVKEDFKPLVPGAPAVDSAQPPTKSPLDIPFEEKFQEFAKPAFSDSPLAYKPLRPSYAGSMSNGVPNQIVPARVDTPQDVPVKEDFKPLVPGAPAVDSAQPPTKSPLDIPFDEKFEEVAKPSFSDSPLAYKPLRPSYAGSMSNGVPNQIVPARVDAPQDVPALNSSQDVLVKEDFKPSVPGTPAQPSTKSSLNIPFEEKFEEVAKPAFSDSPLAYKPLRPSYAGSMSSGVLHQIVLLNSDNCSFPNSRINRKTSSKLHRNQFGESSKDALNRTSNVEESGKPYEIIKERTTFNIENIRESKKFLDPSAGPRSSRKSEEEIDESIPGMKKFRDVLKEVYNSVPIRRYLERRRQAKKPLQYPGEYSLKHLQPGWYSF